MLKLGDKVKIVAGRMAGSIGTIRINPEPGMWEVEIPKVERFCLYSNSELEAIEPSLVDARLRAVATDALRAWARHPDSYETECCMRRLEHVLSQ